MIRIELDTVFDPKKVLEGRASKLEFALAIQIHKDTRRFVPALTESFNNRSHTIGNRIVYPGPYGHYLHEGKVMVNAKTGKGPMYIPEVGYRWPKGAILRRTDRDLTFNTSVHPDAQSHWMDASKRKNMKRWEAMGARIYANGK